MRTRQLKYKRNRVAPASEHDAGALVVQLCQRGFDTSLRYSTFSGWEVTSSAPVALMRALMPGAKLTVARKASLERHPYRDRMVIR